MATFVLALDKCCRCSPELMKMSPKDLPPQKSDHLLSRNQFAIPSRDELYSRRCSMLHGGVALLPILACGSCLMPLPVRADGENSQGQNEGGDDNNADNGIIGSIKSLFDPNEKTKSGKVLPKAYLKSAREVVKTLRDSLAEDGKDVARFRRTADAAKESIREYLSGWRGQQAVIAEESNVSLEKAIRSLADFYSKAGPFASMPEGIKAKILDDLKTAEAFLQGE